VRDDCIPFGCGSGGKVSSDAGAGDLYALKFTQAFGSVRWYVTWMSAPVNAPGTAMADTRDESRQK
jgi:hypothetical protein